MQSKLELFRLLCKRLTVLDVVLLHKVYEEIGVQVLNGGHKANIVAIQNSARLDNFLFVHSTKEGFVVSVGPDEIGKNDRFREEVYLVGSLLVIVLELKLI